MKMQSGNVVFVFSQCISPVFKDGHTPVLHVLLVSVKEISLLLLQPGVAPNVGMNFLHQNVPLNISVGVGNSKILHVTLGRLLILVVEFVAVVLFLIVGTDVF